MKIKNIKAIFLFYYKMLIVLHIALIFFYILLLCFSIILLLNIYLCDQYTCIPFTGLQSTKQKQIIDLTDKIGEDGIWPFSYIGSSILTALSFSFMPIKLNIKNVTTIFLLFFLIMYSIMSFYVHHYIIPIKKYLKENIK